MTARINFKPQIHFYLQANIHKNTKIVYASM